MYDAGGSDLEDQPLDFPRSVVMESPPAIRLEADAAAHGVDIGRRLPAVMREDQAGGQGQDRDHR